MALSRRIDGSSGTLLVSASKFGSRVLSMANAGAVATSRMTIDSVQIDSLLPPPARLSYTTHSAWTVACRYDSLPHFNMTCLQDLAVDGSKMGRSLEAEPWEYT